MKEENRHDLRKRFAGILLVTAVLMSSMFMTACTDKDRQSGNDEKKNTVRAADPMTEEEMKEDDSEGCINDSEDLLN